MTLWTLASVSSELRCVVFDAYDGRLVLLVEHGEKAFLTEVYSDREAAHARAMELRATFIAVGLKVRDR